VDPYRIFIAYSHDDYAIAKRVVARLRKIGYKPLWDKEHRAGWAFPEQIKRGIAYAHVFMPILTAKSSESPWVHQEIGYAMGLDVPIVPIAIGRVPGEMMQDLHAVNVRPDGRNPLQQLTATVIEDALSDSPAASRATFRCADDSERRTEMIVEYANYVLNLREYGRVRQIGSLTSFALPDRVPGHPEWDKHEGKRPRGHRMRKHLRDERRALERHAKEAGCDLVVDLSVAYDAEGPGSKEARLTTLLEFLESMPADRVRVAMRRRAGEEHNLLIVGDWFIAESMSPRPGEGYQLTVFTTHAPTVLERQRQFDEEIMDLLKDSRVPAKDSRDVAIEKIRAELAKSA
jgi:hypothetical protein